MVLSRQISGERFFRLGVFSREKGAFQVLAKRSVQQNQAPDLFQEVTIYWKLGQIKTLGFLQEYQVLNSWNSIGQRYQNFSDACQLNQFIDKNGSGVISSSEWYLLLKKAWKAWELPDANSKAILLKSLYYIAKLEGYPVKESWAYCLSPSLVPDLKTILRSPVKKIPLLVSTPLLLENLNQWLRDQTDFL